MPDVELRCIQCQSNFIFSERDQEIFYQRNIPPPQRCEKCRPSRKKLAMAAVNSNGTKRYEIVCDRCGKKDSVPFAPKPGRNVLCSDCHQANRSRTRLA